MPHTKILFVDDDIRILDGLRRAFRREGDRWECRFANSGPEALQILEGEAFDVVISDMRMPGMDGAQLLTAVADRWPDSVRFILTGQSDLAAVERSLLCTHQLLHKPCDASVLKDHIDRVLLVRSLCGNSALRGIVSCIDALPSLPKLYQDLNACATSDVCTLADVAKIVARDPAMSAKVLQLVNSSFFGVGRTVSTVEQAVALLGMNTLRSLALTIGVFRDLSLSRRLPGFSAEALWEHCVRCGTLARQIVWQISADKHLAEHALMGGLLHDVGKLILLDRLPHDFHRTLTMARENCTSWHEIETSCGDVTHTELGVYLLALWGLPMPIIDAVSLHHAPERIQAPSLNAAAAVYVANVLVQAAAPGQSGNGLIPTLDQQFVERFHLVKFLDGWRKSA